MNWFFIALAAPLLWSINVHFDRYILTRYRKHSGVGSVFLFSTFFSLLFAIGVLIFKNNEILLHSTFPNFFLFLLPGFLNAFGFFCYLQSLKDEESSVVVALFQLSPVFAYFLGYLILGEVLTQQQIFASILILLGVGILSLDLQEDNKIVVKKRIVFFIALSAFLFALNDIIFKGFAIQEDSFVTLLFWQHVAIFFTGLFFFVFLTRYRQDFLFLMKSSRVTLFFLNGTSELFYVVGNLLSNFATLLAPVALVLVVNSHQATFTFLFGILLSLFLPSLVSEKLSSKHLVQKTLAISVITVGSYLLYLS